DVVGLVALAGISRSSKSWLMMMRISHGLRAVGGESESPAHVDIPNVAAAVNDASEQFVDAPSAFDDKD
ncbi:hypothetical protein LINPERHAP2_LOCUS25155, partial [Linum perenne]